MVKAPQALEREHGESASSTLKRRRSEVHRDVNLRPKLAKRIATPILSRFRQRELPGLGKTSKQYD